MYASQSMTSPVKYSPGTSLLPHLGVSSEVFTPPDVTTASSKGPTPANENVSPFTASTSLPLSSRVTEFTFSSGERPARFSM